MIGNIIIEEYLKVSKDIKIRKKVKEILTEVNEISIACLFPKVEIGTEPTNAKVQENFKKWMNSKYLSNREKRYIAMNYNLKFHQLIYNILKYAIRDMVESKKKTDSVAKAKKIDKSAEILTYQIYELERFTRLLASELDRQYYPTMQTLRNKIENKVKEIIKKEPFK